MSKGKYYITTAIAYTSGKPHIGNTYEAVLADSIARFKRKDGYEVFFQTGTDEHGQKIELKAQEAGVTPQEYVDKVAGEVKGLWDLMGNHSGGRGNRRRGLCAGNRARHRHYDPVSGRAGRGSDSCGNRQGFDSHTEGYPVDLYQCYCYQRRYPEAGCGRACKGKERRKAG